MRPPLFFYYAIIKVMSEEKPVKRAPRKKAPSSTAAKQDKVNEIIEVCQNYSADDMIKNGPVKIMLFMKRGASYQTASGVQFSKAQPFQMVSPEEAIILLQMSEDRFEKADPEKVKRFYIP